MEVRIVRSRRRTLGLEVRGETVLVRAPYGLPNTEIQRFLTEHQDWVAKARARQADRQARRQPLTGSEIQDLTRQAKAVIPERVRFYAEKLGVTYGKITIRCQKTRWGSCSSRGDLSFNCTLMKCPLEALDSVVVHELCHRKEMNHSARFYAEVLRVFPDYPKWHRWLKETGSLYLPDGEK